MFGRRQDPWGRQSCLPFHCWFAPVEVEWKVQRLLSLVERFHIMMLPIDERTGKTAVRPRSHDSALFMRVSAVVPDSCRVDVSLIGHSKLSQSWRSAPKMNASTGLHGGRLVDMMVRVCVLFDGLSSCRWIAQVGVLLLLCTHADEKTSSTFTPVQTDTTPRWTSPIRWPSAPILCVASSSLEHLAGF